jgi:hypothetical protein
MFDSPWVVGFVVVILFMAIIVEPIRRFIHYTSRFEQAVKNPHTQEEWLLFWQNKPDEELRATLEDDSGFTPEARQAACEVLERRRQSSNDWDDD